MDQVKGKAVIGFSSMSGVPKLTVTMEIPFTPSDFIGKPWDTVVALFLKDRAVDLLQKSIVADLPSVCAAARRYLKEKEDGQ